MSFNHSAVAILSGCNCISSAFWDPQDLTKICIRDSCTNLMQCDILCSYIFDIIPMDTWIQFCKICFE